MKKEIKSVCVYCGHSIKQSGAIDLKLKSKYEDLVNSVQLLQMLNNDVSVLVKLPDQKKEFSLGSFRLNKLSVDHDGESLIVLNSTNEFVEIDNINDIVTQEPFRVTFKAEIEEEETQEDDEESEDDWDEEEDDE